MKGTSGLFEIVYANLRCQPTVSATVGTVYMKKVLRLLEDPAGRILVRFAVGLLVQDQGPSFGRNPRARLAWVELGASTCGLLDPGTHLSCCRVLSC